jgi:hypothetical protein
VSLCVEPGVMSAVLKLGLIRTFFPFTGLIFRVLNDSFTPCIRLSVFTKATWLIGLDITNPPSIPIIKAPPTIPEYFKKSLRLNLFIGSISVFFTSTNYHVLITPVCQGSHFWIMKVLEIKDSDVEMDRERIRRSAIPKGAR